MYIGCFCYFVDVGETIADTKASSPDLSDPEEFHRKLVEILNAPPETSTQELKKVIAKIETKSK